ncbi:hypothetical protein CCACVL1_27738, partial [Corchorus capsularis]
MVEEDFEDFKGRCSGLVKAATSWFDFRKFHQWSEPRMADISKVLNLFKLEVK